MQRQANLHGAPLMMALRRGGGTPWWRRLIFTAAIATMTAATTEVSTREQLETAITDGESDITVMDLIQIGSSPITIMTKLTLRGGSADAGFEGLEDQRAGLFAIEGAQADVTFTGLSFTKGYSIYNGGCVEVRDGATVVFNDTALSSCTAGLAATMLSSLTSHAPLTLLPLFLQAEMVARSGQRIVTWPCTTRQ